MSTNSRWMAAGLAALLAMMIAWPVSAATRFVNQNGGSDANTGTDATTDAWLTIQHAVNSVADGDELQVSEGLYVENVTNAALHNLTLKGGYDDATWAWEPGANRTIVKAANASANVLTISRTNNTVTGFVLTGGLRGLYGSYPGVDVPLRLTHCIVSNNTSHGIENVSYLNLDARNCLIVQNGGRGVFLNGQDGGDGSRRNYLYNCTIVSNASDGIYRSGRYPGYTTVRNCIISGNGGYGVYRYWTAQADGRALYLDSSCVHGNTAGNVLSASYADRIPAGVGMLCADAMLDSGFALQNGSPCVDAAQDLSGIGITDNLNGAARAGAWDMGCYESAFSAATRYAATYADVTKTDDSGAGTTLGTAKKTINAAMAITAPGGTCTVQPGLYNEHVFVAPGVAVQGAGRDATFVSNDWRAIVMGDANATVSSLSALGRQYSVAVELKGTNNLLADCRVQTTTNGGWGVWISGPSNQVVDCQISSNLFGVYVGLGSPSYATLARCRIADNGNHGLWSNTRPPFYFHNLLVTGNGGNGIVLDQGGDSSSSTRAELFHCTVADNRGHGIIHNGRYTGGILVSNTISAANASYGIIRYSAQPDGHQLFLGHDCIATNILGAFSNNMDRIVFGSGLITNTAPEFLGSGPQPYGLDRLSPCIDAAPGVGVTNDLLFAFRPQRSLSPPPPLEYDMGAYEMFRYRLGTVIMLK